MDSQVASRHSAYHYYNNSYGSKSPLSHSDIYFNTTSYHRNYYNSSSYLCSPQCIYSNLDSQMAYSYASYYNCSNCYSSKPSNYFNPIHNHHSTSDYNNDYNSSDYLFPKHHNNSSLGSNKRSHYSSYSH